MSFEVFHRTRTGRKPRTTEPTIATDRHRKVLRFNAPATRLLAEVDALVILIDRDSGTIALDPASKSVDSWSVARTTSSAWITCARLIADRDLPASTCWPLTVEGDRFTFRP